jgi:hypothetical protein
VALADMPLNLVQHALFLFSPQGSWFSPRGPGLLLAMTGARPIQQRIPSLKNNIFFLNHLLHVLVRPTPKSPGWPWTWTLLQLVGTC